MILFIKIMNEPVKGNYIFFDKKLESQWLIVIDYGFLLIPVLSKLRQSESLMQSLPNQTPCCVGFVRSWFQSSVPSTPFLPPCGGKQYVYPASSIASTASLLQRSFEPRQPVKQELEHRPFHQTSGTFTDTTLGDLTGHHTQEEQKISKK